MCTNQNGHKYQRYQVLHNQAQAKQRFRSELENIEKRILKKYRQSLVHKARPMPAYKFFVPKLNLKPLTVPESPNLTEKRRRILQRYIADPSSYSLSTPSDLPAIEESEISPHTEGGSFLNYSENLQGNERDGTTVNSGTDETEDDIQ